jgi:hypothetical protein
MTARFAVLCAAALAVSNSANAQDARPVRFWINVTDFTLSTTDKLRQYRVTPDVPIPTSLVGWTCKATAPTFEQFPGTKADPANGVPAMPASVYQRSVITCTSKSGSVKASAMCRLTAENEFGSGEMEITDAAGHEDWVGVACRN